MIDQGWGHDVKQIPDREVRESGKGPVPISSGYEGVLLQGCRRDHLYASLGWRCLGSGLLA